MRKIIEECGLEGHEGQLRNFSNHGIIENELGNMKVFNFKKPDSRNYSIRYMFDGSRLIVTGDLGTAIYEWSGEVSLENLAGMNIGYFNGKCEASSEGKKEWKQEDAIIDLDEHFKDNYLESYKEFEENDDITEEYQEKFDRVSEIIEELKSNAEDEISYIAYARESDIHEIEQDAWEWIYNVGNTIPYRHKLHLLGIKLINRRLNEVKLDGKTIQN